MAPNQVPASETLAGSRWSSVESDSATEPVGASTPTSSYEPIESSQTQIHADIELIATYLAKRNASTKLVGAIDRIRDAYTTRVKQTNTEQAIRQLHETVQKLAEKVSKTSYEAPKPALGSYAAAASRGASATKQTRLQQSLNPVTSQKPVPARHKREIILVRGTETTIEKNRTYKELLEQINKSEVAGVAVAIRKLPSGDMILTMEDEQARTSRLANTAWLEVFGPGARIKKREFAVIAHGIRVSQVQSQAQAIADIYQQNPQLQGTIEIVRVAFTKRLLKSGRATGPLIISVTEPEQANRLIDAGLIWSYELHDCEPFTGDCVITQCFKCYQYGHVSQKCHNLQRCGFCAGTGHATNDCLGREDSTKHRCVQCKGNHPSWARECLVRGQHAEAAQVAYSNRPVRYQASTGPVRRIQTAVGPSQQTKAQETARTTNTTEALITTVIDHPLEKWQEPWIEVNRKRTPSPRSASAPPAKRRGRPIGSTKASRNTKDIRTYSTQ
jgi:hypothetical protein